MPKHHRVPRYHLNHFADGDKCIGVFNVGSGKDLGPYPLKGQAQSRSFYPEETEKRLGKLESEMAPIHRNIIADRFSARDIERLALYAVSQYARTQKFWKDFCHFPEDFLEERDLQDILQTEANKQKFIDLCSLVAFAPDQEHMQWAFTDFQRLTAKVLLLNKTRDPHIGFITGDVPVGFADKFLYFELARWMVGRLKMRKGAAEIEEGGFLCFYPLNKDLCLLIYNKHAYSASSRNNKIEIFRKQDIRDINRCLLDTGREQGVYFKNIYYSPDTGFSPNNHVLKGSNYSLKDMEVPIGSIISPAFSFLSVQPKMKDLQTQFYKLMNDERLFLAYQDKVRPMLSSFSEEFQSFWDANRKPFFLAQSFILIKSCFPK